MDVFILQHILMMVPNQIHWRQIHRVHQQHISKLNRHDNQMFKFTSFVFSSPRSESTSQPPLSASFTAFQEQITKTPMRPQTTPHVQTTTEHFNRLTRALPANLESIEETTEIVTKNHKTAVPQPTKIDLKRDIQVLTLNDETPNHSIGKKIDVHHQAPF